MKTITIPLESGPRLVQILSINELDLDRVLFGPVSRNATSGIKYFDTPCAFDIETTNIVPKRAGKQPFAFMYHWQVCIGDQVVFGRTWSEFRQLVDKLKRYLWLNKKNRLVIYVHNLSFEFQFMRRFFGISEMFARAERHPVRFLLDNCIEFRCSMMLSNMSLAKFCENTEGVIFQKLSGVEYNYSKIRTAKTRMSEYELAYCYCDVRGLCECIEARLKEDTMAGIPLTSTGYVRREYRREITKDPGNRLQFLESQLTASDYLECRKAFRGGDTHANLLWVSQHLHNVDSYDLQSSYPACMMMDKYPVGAFFEIRPEDLERPEMGTQFAYLCRIRLTDVRYSGNCGIPYIPVAKCEALRGCVNDNGRVLAADDLVMVVTDIDLAIIRQEYSYNHIYIDTCRAARYGYLPQSFKDVLLRLYTDKTYLKGDDAHYYEYVKQKNKVNSSYGMMVTQIDIPEIEYQDGEWIPHASNTEESLARYYKSRNSFLSYQHGIWVTANARRRLREMLWTVGEDVVYCDTDSIKCKGDHAAEFSAKNEEIIRQAEAMHAYADDRNGKRQYMGIWDYEGRSSDFKTLGAKKYIYIKDGHMTSTIAGVNKQKGKEFFERKGIDGFKIGEVIPDSGHTVAYYDDSDIHDICVKGCHMLTGSSVALLDDTYTIGVTGEYLDLIQKALANITDV